MWGAIISYCMNFLFTALAVQHLDKDRRTCVVLRSWLSLFRDGQAVNPGTLHRRALQRRILSVAARGPVPIPPGRAMAIALRESPTSEIVLCLLEGVESDPRTPTRRRILTTSCL